MHLTTSEVQRQEGEFFAMLHRATHPILKEYFNLLQPNGDEIVFACTLDSIESALTMINLFRYDLPKGDQLIVGVGYFAGCLQDAL